MENKIILDGNSLTLEDVIQVVRFGAKVVLSKESILKMEESRIYVDKCLEDGVIIYGINTGFGKFSDVAISKEELLELQKRLIYADAVGIGTPFTKEIVRAIMLLRINALAKGFSGITQETVNVLIDMLNNGVHPVIREKGSVGSSGDLCPLAHMVLVMMGEGEAELNGKMLSGKEALEISHIKPAVLKAKEGLALINGTCAMVGVAAITVYDTLNIVKYADIVSSLTVEALNGIVDAFDIRIHNSRPHIGQINVAKNLINLCKDSEFITKQGEQRVQDAYTLRCIPQIHGASRPAIDYVKSVIEIEINSATDNPLIFPNGDNPAVLSGGNFHGQPVAIAMDTLAIAVSELGNVSERRIERLLNPALSNGLPAFLVGEGGLNCGFMVAQYAAAAVVSENKILAHPASVDSIPTSANQEDHVSFGTIAARKANTILQHVQYVLGIELICACQAIDFRLKETNKKLGQGTQIAYDYLRKQINFMPIDKILYIDMDIAKEIISKKELLNLIEDQIVIL